MSILIILQNGVKLQYLEIVFQENKPLEHFLTLINHNFRQDASCQTFCQIPCSPTKLEIWLKFHGHVLSSFQDFRGWLSTKNPPYTIKLSEKA